MTTLRRSWFIVACLLCSIFVVACGSNAGNNTTTGSNNGGGNNKTTMVNPTATTTGNQMMTTTPMVTPKPTATAAPMGGNPDALIHVGKAMINGKQVMVLTTAKGFSIYYRMSDPAPASTCTGACAKAWPPLLASNAMMMLTSSMPLPKKLTVHMTANGNQIEYDGHPLYTYAGDMAPGQINGRGIGMVWYLAGVGL